MQLCRSNSYRLHPRRVTWIKIKRECVKSGCSGALIPDRLGLNCKANKCSAAGTGGLGALTAHETSHLVSPMVMSAQPATGECRDKYKLV